MQDQAHQKILGITLSKRDFIIQRIIAWIMIVASTLNMAHGLVTGQYLTCLTSLGVIIMMSFSLRFMKNGDVQETLSSTNAKQS